jgi:hypothetical protein
MSKIDKAEPKRAYARKDRDAPKWIASQTDNVDPNRDIPQTDIEAAKRPKHLNAKEDPK